jgi:serine/threonine-protein kinase HipA
MRRAKVYVNGIEAGLLSEIQQGAEYTFEYNEGYDGLEVSRTMLTSQQKYTFTKFPPFFEGLLPEGIQLEGLLKLKK